MNTSWTAYTQCYQCWIDTYSKQGQNSALPRTELDECRKTLNERAIILCEEGLGKKVKAAAFPWKRKNRTGALDTLTVGRWGPDAFWKTICCLSKMRRFEQYWGQCRLEPPSILSPLLLLMLFRKQVSESLPLEGVSSHHTYSSFSHNSTLSIMYFNARSVFRKLDNLKLVCAIHHPDVICIVESWLDKEISDSELSLDGYNVSRVNRNRHGGGVLIEIYSCTQSCF